jgi:hypothetical protein
VQQSTRQSGGVAKARKKLGVSENVAKHYGRKPGKRDTLAAKRKAKTERRSASAAPAAGKKRGSSRKTASACVSKKTASKTKKRK